ncbi:hypothetical protein RB614_00345 [Phytohabitans sp. ZYX-F-186]|uniref:HTH iclR-type domain-containing protein n=1 Tax=Phytohabitans maris TaxID=3071409 RepID=A0ABU0Z7D7_9ACTN|nr:hypothetical protein [Phytohabitans sp. ZYX-F-186]MDQ7902967.1 hypothetical protein [Phytohabitans sp. ZYX-F-186]
MTSRSAASLAAGKVREVAHAAGVSVGQAHDALAQLQQSGFLDPASKRLDRTDELLDYWAAAYLTGLGRRLEIATYSGDPSRPVSRPDPDQPVYLSSESAKGADIARSGSRRFATRKDPRQRGATPRGHSSTPTSWPAETPVSARSAGLGGHIMLDPTKCDPAQLDLVDVVVTELLAKSTRPGADDVMVVGARCRDVLQSALGHEFPLRATTDIDLGLAVANWRACEELTETLPLAGDTGIRYRVVSGDVDLMPFGPAEDPPSRCGHSRHRRPHSHVRACRALGRIAKDLLYQRLKVSQARDWPSSLERCRALVRAMELGMFTW